MSVVLLLAACTQQSSSTDLQSAVQPTSSAPVSAGSPVQADAAVPDTARVFRDIFKESSAGHGQVKLPDGRYASLWQGHAFELDGKPHYVAFAEYTDAAENEYPAEGDTVSLAEATYALVDGAWQLRGTRQGIGRFGAFNKAPQIDEAAQLQSATVDGRYLVGIPTVETAMAGARLTFYEIFAFSPAETDWTYLGFVPGGRDTRAGCTADAGVPQPVPCAASAATLRFAASGAAGSWPTLRVEFSGDVVGDDGRIRKADDRDAVEYHVDPSKTAYVRVQP
jgi:hypothetical protein